MCEQKIIKFDYEWNENESVAITDKGMSITNPYFQFEKKSEGEQG